MLSKKHNDLFYWKNKLEALNSLPEQFAPEKDAMWEKLQDRLQEKPAGNKAKWYWMAAALLPLSIAQFVMMYKTGDTFEVAVTKDKNEITAPAFVPAISKEEIAITVCAPAEKKQSIVNARLKNIKPADTAKKSEVVVAAIPAENLKTEINLNNTQPVDTALNFASTNTAKKKLQVVHINELETFPSQFTLPVSYAQNLSNTKNKKNKTSNLSFTTLQNSIGFKIKLSSKN